MSVAYDLPATRTEAMVAAEVLYLFLDARLVDSADMARALAVAKITLDDLRDAGRRLTIPARYQAPKPAPCPETTFAPTRPRGQAGAIAETSWVDRRCHRCKAILGPDDGTYSNCVLCRRSAAQHEHRKRERARESEVATRRMAAPLARLVTVRVRPDGEGMEVVCRACDQAISDGDHVVMDGIRHASCPANSGEAE